MGVRLPVRHCYLRDVISLDDDLIGGTVWFCDELREWLAGRDIIIEVGLGRMLYVINFAHDEDAALFKLRYL